LCLICVRPKADYKINAINNIMVKNGWTIFSHQTNTDVAASNVIYEIIILLKWRNLASKDDQNIKLVFRRTISLS